MGAFTGKVALVTGAARGLGRVTVLAFVREGARVVFTDIDDAGGQETLGMVRKPAARACSSPLMSATSRARRRWSPRRWSATAAWTAR